MNVTNPVDEVPRLPNSRPVEEPARSPFTAASWFRALDIRERSALVAGGGSAGPDEERLQQWRSSAAFQDDAVFARRLARDGLTVDGFQALLAAPAEELAARSGTSPGWLDELEAAFGDGAVPCPPWFAELRHREPGWGFLALLTPLIGRGLTRIETGAEALRRRGAVPFDPERVVAQLAPSLCPRLYEIVEKTLILELNVARLRGELDGATPEERFAAFLRRLERPEHALPLLAEYPVLARQCVETIDRWAAFSLEFLGHLAEDRGELVETFGELGELVEVEGGAGDTHRDGRAVQILTFKNGLRLVYKPRPLGVERHFQALLRWLNERGDHPPFRTLTVVDRPSHGWTEFVEPSGCDTRQEIERFYLRQGGYLALLYALEANDFHFQNVLAAGEHPVLVDLESLFQQRVFTLDTDTASGQASSLVAYSVIRTGLLPQFAWRDDSERPLELSGLGGAEGQVDAGARATADRLGTDEMRMVHRELEFPGGRNRPSLQGEPQSALDWTDAIEAGFESVYRTLLSHREELLAPDGPIQSFADDPVRVILRHTQFYRLFLLDCFHPDLQRDALERDRHLDRLWTGADTRPEVGLLAPLEADQLRSLDIPMFTTHPASRDLLSACGQRLSDYFATTGLDLVDARLRTLGEDDLERQRWMIGASLKALDTAAPATAPRSVHLDDLEPASRDRLIAAAARVGGRLSELALVGSEGEASWVGITATDERHFMPSPLTPDLYGGVAGVALFLAYLGARTGDGSHTALAEAAWRTVAAQIDEVAVPGGEMGAFLGTGGVLYCALHLTALWRGDDGRRPGPLDLLDRLLDHLEESIATDRSLDVLSGSAGCIPVLLAAHRMTGDGRTLDLATACGEHLLASAQEMKPAGIAWPSARAGERALSGFSHGAAGFAWALFHLAAAGGGERFEAAARRALDFERTLFDAEERNWRDLRRFLGPEGGFTVAWCNGAAGIGLSRLDILALLGTGGAEPWRQELLADVDHALATTRRAGFSFNHCLCHGALGNLELLAQDARRLEEPESERRVLQAAAVICDEVEAGTYHCGVPGGFETPGLLDGLAGIGYGLLRLADPEAVPNILLLAPPG